MGTFMSAIFLIAILGMLIVYPMYFYYLNEFKRRMAADHAVIWNRLSVGIGRSGLQAAYRALQLSRKGQIEGVPLSSAVLAARRKAAITLYLGMMFFLIVLAIGLVDSVAVGKY